MRQLLEERLRLRLGEGTHFDCGGGGGCCCFCFREERGARVDFAVPVYNLRPVVVVRGAGENGRFIWIENPNEKKKFQPCAYRYAYR